MWQYTMCVTHRMEAVRATKINKFQIRTTEINSHFHFFDLPWGPEKGWLI